MASPPVSRLLGQPLTYPTEALLLATPLPAGRLCFAVQEETYWVSITGGYLPVGGGGGGGGGDVTASPSPLESGRIMIGAGGTNAATSSDLDLTEANLSALLDEHLGQTYVIAQSAGVEDRLVRWREDGTPGQYLIGSALTSRDNGDLHHHTEGGFRVSGTLADSSEDLKFLYLHGHALGTHGSVVLGFPPTNTVTGSSLDIDFFKVGHSMQLWRWNGGARTDANSYGAWAVAHDDGEVALGKLSIQPASTPEEPFESLVAAEPPFFVTGTAGPWGIGASNNTLNISVNDGPTQTLVFLSQTTTALELIEQINAGFPNLQAGYFGTDATRVAVRSRTGGAGEKISVLPGGPNEVETTLGITVGDFVNGTDWLAVRPGQTGDFEADIFLQGNVAVNGILDPVAITLIKQADLPIELGPSGTLLWADAEGNLRFSSDTAGDTVMMTVPAGAGQSEPGRLPVFGAAAGSFLDNGYWSIDSAAPYALEYRTDQAVLTTGGIFNVMVGSSTQPTVPAGCHATIVSNENPTDDALMMLAGARESGLLLGANASLKWSESTFGLAFNSYSEDRLQINQGVWVGSFAGDPGPETFGARNIQAVDTGGPNPGLGQILCENSGTAGARTALDMVSGDSGRCSILFRTPSSGTAGNGSIQFEHGLGQMRFYNPGLRWALHADGGLSAFNSTLLPSFGPGSINASGLYDDGLLVADHVFEAFYEGKPRDEKHADYQMKTLEEERVHVQKNLHLSTMPSRAEWEEGGKKSMGDLVTRLWETIETQHLYICALSDRIENLESK